MHILDRMRPIARKITERGLGSECADDAVAPPESGFRPAVSCPPPQLQSTRPASSYSHVARRRETASMLEAAPPSADAAGARRRHTMRMALSVERVEVGMPPDKGAVVARLRLVDNG
ncbi:MAG: hypothetical protein JWP87_3699 [Labilithrix sp.]|nr:hypothetical protein [Labilithrix sp.]